MAVEFHCDHPTVVEDEEVDPVLPIGVVKPGLVGLPGLYYLPLQRSDIRRGSSGGAWAA
jgi:hypothetical protein